jgi:hypothetical protein
MNRKCFVASAAGMLVACQISGAQTVTGHTGAIVPGAPQTTKTSSLTTIEGFHEQQNVLLASDLAVDVSSANYGVTEHGVTDTGGSIAQGTLVDSYFLSDYTSTNTGIVTGSITFAQKILGFEFRDASLNSTDALFGASSLTSAEYQHGASQRGYENVDTAKISSDGYTLTLDSQFSTPGDQIRVFTAVTPEPITMSLGFAGLALALKRRLKAKSA